MSIRFACLPISKWPRVSCLDAVAQGTARLHSPRSHSSGAQAAAPGCQCKPSTLLAAARLVKQGCIHIAKGTFESSCSVAYANVRLASGLTPRHSCSRSKPGVAILYSCKLQRETERRAVRSARCDLEKSSSASLSSSLPSQLPPSRGHLNRVPEHESGDGLFCLACMCESRYLTLCAALFAAALSPGPVSFGAAMPS